MLYLAERGRIDSSRLSRTIALLRQRQLFVEIYVTRRIAHAVARINRVQVPDMPDRIIAATALHRRVPIISRDNKIRSSGLPTIW
jgi:PIN domain nuclease of toxin-antitoxin system